MPYSIRAQLIAMLVLLLMIPFVIMALVFWNEAADSIRESIEKSTAQTMDQYAEFVERTSTQINMTASQILSSDVTQEWLDLRVDSGDFADPAYLRQHFLLKKFLNTQVSGNLNVLSVNIFYQNWDLWNLDGEDYKQTDWYGKYAASGNPWIPAHYDSRQQNGSYANHEAVVSLLYPLTQLQSLKVEGIIKINMKATLFQEPLDKLKLGKTGAFFVLDPQGHAVLRTSPAANSAGADPEAAGSAEALPDGAADAGRMLRQSAGLAGVAGTAETGGSGELAGTAGLGGSAGLAGLAETAGSTGTGMQRVKDRETGRLYFFRAIPETGWILVGEVPEKEFYQKITNVSRTIVVAGACLFGITVLLTFWFSSGIARPLSQMGRSMNYAEQGNFLKAGAVMAAVAPKQNEVGYLVAQHVKMIQRLHTYMETEFHLVARRRSAEYKALLLQINPHFLNNTLEVINSLAAQRRNADIERVVQNVSRMLRYTLKVDSDLIRLRDEIQYIRAYISILSVCYGDRVRFVVDDDGANGEVMIPKLLLQPMIENAVKYSLEAVETAVIAVSFRSTAEGLEIRIRDNGTGMERKRIEELLRDAEAGGVHRALEQGEKGIGLKNAIARCRIYYGDKQSVTIRSQIGAGTEIELRLPLKG